jgi:uncharacterized membrane protein YdjX (TVP38/TMEM64 family)
MLMNAANTHANMVRTGTPSVSDDAGVTSRHMKRLLRILSAVSVVTLVAYLYSQGLLTQENLKLAGVAMPTWLFLPAYMILPLLGFPISIVLLASGLKYGFALSVAIAAVGMGFHTFSAWYIAHGYFRKPLQTWLSGTRFDLPVIPDRHQTWFTSLFVIVPGLPYSVKLYSLALTNLPFRRYLPIVWCLHVANSVVFIGLGAAAGELNAGLMAGLAVLAVAMIVVTNRLKRFAAQDTTRDTSVHDRMSSA